MASQFRFIGLVLTFILISSPLATPSSVTDPGYPANETGATSQDDSTRLALLILQMISGEVPEEERRPLYQSGSTGDSESVPQRLSTNATSERRSNGCPIRSFANRGSCKVQTMSVKVAKPNCFQTAVNYTLCAGRCPSANIVPFPDELESVECNLGKQVVFSDTCKPKSFRRKRITLQCENGEEDVEIRMVKKCQCSSLN
ncbi:hypothetical protein HOLleu_12470 [Holothuria leucospilota]|uniref:CTCK domain-containing protein n=1 Tax=Holothuria leucospilota TaxID=206669 RepID=A0A9Q1CBB8_HOLLE|nr:hypothetical protein HOLleu_12470 [Holothuria leucospilota]